MDHKDLERFLMDNGFEKTESSSVDIKGYELSISPDSKCLIMSMNGSKRIYDLKNYMLIKDNSNHRTDILPMLGYNPDTVISYLTGYDSDRMLAVICDCTFFTRNS